MTTDFRAFWAKRRESIHGWSLSFVVHGVLGTVALSMMTNVLEIQKPEPFRLNMSILKPAPQPTQQPQPIQKTQKTQQKLTRQTVVQTPVSHERVKPQRLERKPIEQQVVQTTKSFETPVTQHQPVTRPVQQMTSATSVTQPVQKKAPTTPVTHRVIAQAQPKVLQRDVSALPQPTMVTDRQVTKQVSVQQVDVVTHTATQSTEYVETESPKLKHIPAIVTGSISRSAPSPQKVATPKVTPSQVVSSVLARPHSIQSSPRRVIQQAVVTKVQPSVVTRDVKQDPAATTDYQWVATSLMEKVKQLKRYPSRAKRKKWEGTVMLRVYIRSNGEIQDVHVLESSGHATLDQEAVNTVKMASPLTLKYPIVGRSIVPVNLPFTYKLT